MQRKNKSKNKKQKMLICVLVISLTIIFSVFLYTTIYLNDTTIIVEVSAPDDDARTFIAGGGSETEDGEWATLQLSPSYSFGIRFTNVSLPHGVKIKEAYVELYSTGTPGHLNPNCRIYCDNVDNAVNFSIVGVLDISGRIYTHNYVIWNTTVPYGKWVKTSSIVAPLQEIINRKNWTSGNAIAVLFVSEGLRGYSATFQNYEKGYPAKLYVKWEETS